MQALSEHVEAVKANLPPKKEKSKEGKGKSEKALIEARVYLTGALFKMDHHPMEVGRNSIISQLPDYGLHV